MRKFPDRTDQGMEDQPPLWAPFNGRRRCEKVSAQALYTCFPLFPSRVSIMAAVISCFKKQSGTIEHPAPWTELVLYPSSMQTTTVELTDLHCVSQPNIFPFTLCRHLTGSIFPKGLC